MSGSAISRNTLPLAESSDIRRGADVAAGLTFGPNRLAPEFSYSEENDYISYSGALNFSRDFNDKNTTLNAGWSHSYDRVLPNRFTYITTRQIKNSDDFLLGGSNHARRPRPNRPGSGRSHLLFPRSGLRWPQRRRRGVRM